MLKGNLLIVDDEPMLLKQLELILEEHADKVYLAANGIEALAVLSNEIIHCVICDINMPKMNGVQVIKELRTKDAHLPFIFYTGHGNRDLMMEAAQYGAFDFLDKPNLDGLEETVARGLRSGLSQQTTILPSEGEHMSEYQKILKRLEELE